MSTFCASDSVWEKYGGWLKDQVVAIRVISGIGFTASDQPSGQPSSQKTAVLTVAPGNACRRVRAGQGNERRL